MSSTHLRHLVQLRSDLVLKLCNHILQYLLKSGTEESLGGGNAEGGNKSLHTYTISDMNKCSPEVRALLAVAGNTSLVHWGDLHDKRKLMVNQKQVWMQFQEGKKGDTARSRSASMEVHTTYCATPVASTNPKGAKKTVPESPSQTLFDERARLLMESVVDHKKMIKHLQAALESFKGTAAIQATQTGREKVRLEETQSRVLQLERSLSALQAKCLSYASSNMGLEERFDFLSSY